MKRPYFIDLMQILNECQLVNWTLHNLLKKYDECLPFVKNGKLNSDYVVEECYPSIKDFINSIEEFIILEIDRKNLFDYGFEVHLFIDDSLAYQPKLNPKSSNLFISGQMVRDLIRKYSKSNIIAGLTDEWPESAEEVVGL